MRTDVMFLWNLEYKNYTQSGISKLSGFVRYKLPLLSSKSSKGKISRRDCSPIDTPIYPGGIQAR